MVLIKTEQGDVQTPYPKMTNSNLQPKSEEQKFNKKNG